MTNFGSNSSWEFFESHCNLRQKWRNAVSVTFLRQILRQLLYENSPWASVTLLNLYQCCFLPLVTKNSTSAVIDFSWVIVLLQSFTSQSCLRKLVRSEFSVCLIYIESLWANAPRRAVTPEGSFRDVDINEFFISQCLWPYRITLQHCFLVLVMSRSNY